MEGRIYTKEEILSLPKKVQDDYFILYLKDEYKKYYYFPCVVVYDDKKDELQISHSSYIDGSYDDENFEKDTKYKTISKEKMDNYLRIAS